jgi:hypothetical protein
MLKKMALLSVVIGNFVFADSTKMFVIYTPSHEELFEHWFFPSFKLYNSDLELVVEKIDQTCESALFKKKGWKDTTLQKVQMIIQAIHRTWNYYFIYSDVDIQFFGPIKNELNLLMQQYDLVIQKDHPKGTVCSGFFACRSNEKTLALWQDVYKAMETIEKYSDQGALNYCLIKQKNPYDIAWTYLPETYFGGATLTGHRWNPEEGLPIPHNPKMHHANWTVGIVNKKEQLRYVKIAVEAQ